MKKTQFIELYKTIKKTATSFIAITAFIAFAIGLFSGMSCGANALKLTTDKYFKDYFMYDIQVSYKYGFNENEISSLKEKEGIEVVEGGYQINQMFTFNGATHQAVLNSITSEVNVLNQIEGRLPIDNKEIVVEKLWAKNNGLKLGDEIKLKHDDGYLHTLNALYNNDLDNLFTPISNEDGMNYLTNDTFKVVGFCESPIYASKFNDVYGASTINSAPVNVAFFLDESSFDAQSFLGYTTIYFRFAELNKYKFFEDEYKNRVEELNAMVNGYIKTIAEAKYNRLIANAQSVSPPFDASVLKSEQYGCATRTSNSALVYVYLMSDACNNLRYVLALSLFVIALLISLIVINRLIAEQHVLIGTKKALGFSGKEISSFFISYTLLACIFAIIFGLFMARFIISPIVLSVVKGLVTVTGAVYRFDAVFSIVICLICFICIFLTTWVLCRINLKRNVLALLNGTNENKAKTRLYEKTKLYKRLSLFSKTMINNMFNEKRRVFATVISILGVTSLIVCGFNFSFVVSNSSEEHFNKYQTFDYVIYYDNEVTGAKDEIVSILEEDGVVFTNVNAFSGLLKFNNDVYEPFSGFATSEKSFKEMYDIVGEDGKSYDIKDGVYLTEALYRYLDDSKEAFFIDSSGAATKFHVDKAMKSCAIIPLLFVSEESFSDLFGYAYEENAIIISSHGKDLTETFSNIEKVSGFLSSLNFKAEELSILGNVSGAFVAVSMIFLVIAVVMAFLVVMNLLYTFITNKKKELLTLLINGYKLKDAKRYIYQDTILLSVIGIVLGCVGGTVLGQIATQIINVEFVWFTPKINLLSIILGVVLTSFFLGVILTVSLKKINKFKLTDLFK